MRRKPDISIAHRAFAEVIAKYGGTVEAARKLGIARSCIQSWKYGDNVPGAYALQAMDRAGFDVHYILSGFRSKP